ncbi:hypothetical protein [Rubritalea tangerina]|uniref:Uncharacterized protein n=1 Tax=Rubritalea tangerina TaxID=430798 RepID=A0ABW4Z5P8_9BACT
MSSASFSGNSHFKTIAQFLGNVRGWCALRYAKYMSYSLDLTLEELPTDKKAAYEQIEQLREELYAEELSDEDLRLNFKPLYDALLSKYPCICSPAGENSPWSDGPLINNFGSKHAIIAVTYSSVDEAVPFILQTCKKLGYTVYDGQEDVFHFPVGTQPQVKAPWWKFW